MKLKLFLKVELGQYEANSERWCFSISDAVTGEKLGNIGLKITDINERIVEVGFMLKESAQGKGYATAALNLIKAFVFDTLNLKKITAICSTQNAGSYKLLEKVGFVREKHLLQNTLINGQLVDDYVYELTAPVI
jgi:RimJ/RimL family protein N-acetyltransferase